MSNLGLRILYEVLNDRPDRLAERCFAPDVDLQAQLRAEGLPLWSLETRRALSDFDVLGVSLGYELTYTNLLDMLDLGGLGLTTAERRETDPLVIAGGSSVLNPEPVADYLDAVLLGEGEDAVLEMSDALERIGWSRRRGPAGEWRREATRAQALRELARHPRRLRSFSLSPALRPRRSLLAPGAARQKMRRRSSSVASPPTSRRTCSGIRQLVPNIAIVFDRAQLEVMRGCTRGCRFCQAGMHYRPLRERAPDVAVAAARAILRLDRLRGDRPDQPLDRRLHVRQGGAPRPSTAMHPGATVSLPSTRVDAFTVELVDAISPHARRGGFTFAPEAGSQRLRDVINKGVSDEEIVDCAELAFRHGWSSLKLYFMIGLPGETMDDVLAIAGICRRALAMGRRHHGGKAQVKANVSTFVPKVATPFMWAGQDSTEEIEAKVGGPAKGDARPRPGSALERSRQLAPRGGARTRRSAAQRGRSAGLAERRPLRCLGRALRLPDLARGLRGGGARPGLVRPARDPARRGPALGPPELRRHPRVPGAATIAGAGRRDRG